MTHFDQPRKSRPGHWLEGKGGSRILTFVIIPLLLIAALLLPPISVVQRVLDAGMTGVTDAGGVLSDPDGTQVNFPPATAEQPYKSFRAKLASVPRVAFLEGSAGNDLLTAAKAIPSNLVAKSPFYQLTLRGAAPSESGWLMPIPNDSEPYETLDVYTWDQTAGRWQWVPHNVIRDDDQIESRLPFVPGSLMVFQTNPVQAAVSADVALASSLPGDSQGALATVHPTGLYLGGGGALDGSVDGGFSQANSAAAVVPVVRNYSGPVVRTDLLANMLSDPAEIDAHVDALVNEVVGNGYNGVSIDYHGLDPTLRVEFNTFIAKLTEKLHAQSKTLSVRVERPNQIAEDRWDTGPYDWQAIGLLADSVQIPAPLDPQAFMPNGQLDALLTYAVGQIDRNKVEIVFTGQSIEQAGSYFLLKNYQDALQPLIGRIESDQTVVKPGEPLNLSLVSKNPNSGLVYDPNLGTYVYRYADDQDNARTVWLENAASLSHKIQSLGRYNVHGFVVENLPADGQDPDLWTLMRNYQQGHAQPINSNFVVEWVVKDSQGKSITESHPLTDVTKLAMIAPNQPGDLQIQAAIKDRGQIVGQATASGIAVATYTPVPSATPEATATPEPAATPSVAQLTVTSDVVNVRAGPGTNYPKVGQLQGGETHQITGKSEDGGWYQFAFNNDKGWVSGEMVSLGGPTDGIAVVKAGPPPTVAPAAAAPPAAAPAAVAPAGGGNFGYGIQVADWDIAGSAQSVTGMGFNWVKKQVPWKDCEGSPGAINWGCADDFVNTMNAAGLNVLLSVPKAPTWARPGNTDLSVEGPPADPNTYGQFVGAMAGRYCGRVQAIEVWNEQNMDYEWGREPFDAGRYVRILASAYNAIKAACPQTKVISGALTPTGAPPPWAVDDFTYLRQMFAAGANSYMDGVGAHPSGYNVSPDVSSDGACAFITQKNASFRGPCDSPHHSWSFRSTMEGYRSIMVQNGAAGKRIWPTEFGWAAGGALHPSYGFANDNSYEEQAQWTVRAYQMMKSWGWVGPAILWNLNFNVTNPGTELAQWGIVGHPAYSALASMPK